MSPYEYTGDIDDDGTAQVEDDQLLGQGDLPGLQRLPLRR